MSRQLQTDRRVKDHIDSKLKSSQQLEARLLAAPLLSDGESARVTNLELQVGLLLGAVGQAGKETLLQLIPTPTEEGQSPVVALSSAGAHKVPAKSKSSKSQQGIHVDIASLNLHASLVINLLPGGLALIGAYFLGPVAANEQALLELSRLKLTPDTGAFWTAVLCIDNASGKAIYQPASASARPRQSPVPCELKYGPMLENLQSVACRYSPQLQLPVHTSGKQMISHIRRLVAEESNRIGSGLVFLGRDCCHNSSKSLHDLTPPSSQKPLEAELLTSPSPATSSGEMAAEESAGCLSIGGALQGLAFCHKRASLPEVANCLKADLKKTLAYRVALAAACAEPGEADLPRPSEPAFTTLLDAHASKADLMLPNRVTLPYQESIVFCDYLQPGEEAAAAVERISWALPCAQSDPSLVESCESPAAPLKSTPAVAVKLPARSSALVGLTPGWIVAALAAALLAIALLMLMLSAHTSSS